MGVEIVVQPQHHAAAGPRQQARDHQGQQGRIGQGDANLGQGSGKGHAAHGRQVQAGDSPVQAQARQQDRGEDDDPAYDPELFIAMPVEQPQGMARILAQQKAVQQHADRHPAQDQEQEAIAGQDRARVVVGRQFWSQGVGRDVVEAAGDPHRHQQGQGEGHEAGAAEALGRVPQEIEGDPAERRGGVEEGMAASPGRAGLVRPLADQGIDHGVDDQ